MNGKTWLEPRKGRHVNSCIPIDRNRIAMATDAGVVLLDTRNGKERCIPVQDSGSGSAEVLKIFVDSKHRLWCFTAAPGVALVDINDQEANVKWLNATLPDTDKETHSETPLFHEDSNGVVWVVPTEGTFAYFDERTWALVPYPLVAVNGLKHVMPRIRRYYSDHQGNLWAICPHNLALVNFMTTNVSLSKRADNGETRAVLQDKSGAVLTGSYDGQLYGADFEFRAKKGIYTLYRDSQGRLWIGTKGDGLYLRCYLTGILPISFVTKTTSILSAVTTSMTSVKTHAGAYSSPHSTAVSTSSPSVEYGALRTLRMETLPGTCPNIAR